MNPRDYPYEWMDSFETIDELRRAWIRKMARPPTASELEEMSGWLVHHSQSACFRMRKKIEEGEKRRRREQERKQKVGCFIAAALLGLAVLGAWSLIQFLSE